MESWPFNIISYAYIEISLGPYAAFTPQYRSEGPHEAVQSHFAFMESGDDCIAIILTAAVTQRSVFRR